MNTRFVLGLVLAGSVACVTQGENPGTSESAHTAGEIVWTNDVHGWVEVDRATFDAMPARRVQRTAPEDHLATRRLQTWIDRYDTIVRAMVRKTGEELAAPRPQARVVIERDVNANISVLPACIARAKERAEDRPKTIVMTGPRTKVEGISADCADAKNWQMASGLAWFNGLGGMQVVPGDTSVAIMSSGRREGEAARAAIVASVPFVNVNAGVLAANISERAAAVVLAHELAHYYRTHQSTGVAGKYDFWYDRDHARA